MRWDPRLPRLRSTDLKSYQPLPARIYYGLLLDRPRAALVRALFFLPSPSAAPALFDVLYMLYVWVL